MQTREKAYGENHKLTLIDKFGIYWSHSKIIKIAKSFREPVHCLDIGYDAKLLNSLQPYIENGFGIDVSISPDLKDLPKLKFIETSIETGLSQVSTKLFNFIVMNSVLEHLSDHLSTLHWSYKHLNENGILLINVPTWLGKEFLEFSAFKLGLSPKYEMDDHKMYYDKKDLWPLLVKAGFKPSKISMKYHKFGLNLFCKTIK